MGRLVEAGNSLPLSIDSIRSFDSNSLHVPFSDKYTARTSLTYIIHHRAIHERYMQEDDSCAHGTSIENGRVNFRFRLSVIASSRLKARGEKQRASV